MTVEPTALEKLQNELREAKEKMEKQGQILQSPEVQKVLFKIANNQPVIFADEQRDGKVDNPDDDEGSAQAKPSSMKEMFGRKPKDPTEVDLNELSNEEFASVIGDAMEKYFEQMAGQITEQATNKVSELDKKFEGLSSSINKFAATQQVKETQNKYTDFDDYKEDMQKVLQKYPNLSIEDAYRMAKSNHLIKHPPTSETASEKPESSFTPPQWKPLHERTFDTGGGGEDSSKDSSSSGRSAGKVASGSRNFRALVDSVAQNQVSQHYST